jgi:hypothetical protein
VSPANVGAWWLALVAAWLALCLPLLVVDLPPLTDYPNHLARMVILSRLGDDPLLSSFYEVRWGIIPDLAIDTFMPTLVGALSPVVAGKLLLAGILLLDVAGAATYAAIIHGRRTWWSLGSALAGHNIAFMMGFLNFDVALGLSMLLAAGWIRLRRSYAGWTAVFGVAAATILFFCHLMGLFFFLVLVGSFEASILWASVRETEWMKAPTRRALAAAWPLAATSLPAAVLYPFSGLSGASGTAKFLTAQEKLIGLTAPFVNYDFVLDLVTCCAVWGLLLACLITRRLAVAPAATVAVVLVTGLFAVLPTDLKETSFLDTRLSVMLGFLVFTTFRPRISGYFAAAVGIAFPVLLCVRVAAVSHVWDDWQTDTTNVRVLAARVQPGDRIIQISVEPDEVSDYWGKAPIPWRLSTKLKTEYHMPGYFFVERSAHWPYLFANPNQQPIRLRQPYQDLGYAADDVPGHADLSKRRAEGNPSAPNPYCAFDIVVLMGTWAEPEPATLAPDWLEFVEANRTAALYRVRAPRRCSPPSHHLQG